MKTFAGIILWVLVAAVRAVLWVIGWFAVAFSLAGRGAYHTPRMWRMWADVNRTDAIASWSRWEKYKWFAWRNPTPGFIGLWKQPIPEDKPNPDQLVRNENHKSASRWMQHGYYWEYWYQRQIDWKIRGKHYQWFEFRIGWKFVDGNDEFFPTLQCAPHSS